MADPLNVTSAILAILTAAKGLYNFIDHVVDGPGILKNAQSDLCLTVEILEDLRKHLDGQDDRIQRSGETFRQKQALRPVLSRCLQVCEAFRVLMHNSVQHSDERVNVWDRSSLALKEKSIQFFREEISLTRECVKIAARSFNLVTSMTTYEKIEEIGQDAREAKEDIERRLVGIESAVQAFGTGLDETAKKFLENKKSALEEHLRLCEECLTAVENASRSKDTRYRASFKDTKTGQRARAIVGLAAKDLPEDIYQEFGDSDLGDESITFIGAGDSETVLSLFGRSNAQRAQAMQWSRQDNLRQTGRTAPHSEGYPSIAVTRPPTLARAQITGLEFEEMDHNASGTSSSEEFSTNDGMEAYFASKSVSGGNMGMAPTLFM